MTLAAIITEAKNGSKTAHQLLFDRLSARSKLLCQRYIKSHEDAEEVMQDGFYKFFKGLVTFIYVSEAGVFCYVKRIMVNECLMKLRKTNSFNLATEPVAAEVPVGDSVLEKLASAEIYRMIIHLPAGYRTVFNLHAIEGYEHKEIAALLGISDNTSRSQFFKARGLLQKMLITNGNDYGKQGSK
ncbi:MAG: RNA polymerase sigma factor [Ferruginibacter sp.]|nr:RNA polymerase sigma factor [Ferruginibacter sp.]